jgi:arsenate reductase
MAAAFFNDLADPTLARAASAGTQPIDRVHPEVVQIMREVGHDLSAASPRLLSPSLAAGASLLVTMGCGESCPVVPGLETQDWQVEDPKGQSPERIRRIREEIRQRVQRLIAAKGWSRGQARRTS